MQPETRYAKSGNVNIAYQVVGDGPPDLIAVDVISHLELDWEIPSKARFFTQLASICRLFRVNQRGTGMSERDVGVPTLETRMDDIRAVLDAVGPERAVLFAPLGPNLGFSGRVGGAACFADRSYLVGAVSTAVLTAPARNAVDKHAGGLNEVRRKTVQSAGNGP